MKQQSKSAKMTRSDMRDALLRSGYLLEMRVQAFLEARKWHAQTSVAYPDPQTGKSREMDVSGFLGCGRLEPWKDGMTPVWVHILAECVNNPNPVVLVMRTTDEKYRSVDFNFNGAPQYILGPHPIEDDKEWWTPVPHACDWRNFHHYAAGSVAFQYCSFTKKKQNAEWMAHHEEHHFDSIGKLCDILDHKLQRVHRLRDSYPNPSVQVFYPVLVLEGDLYEARSGKKGVRLKKVSHSKLVRRILQDGRTVERIIDVVTERGFPAFVELVETELHGVAAKLVEHEAKVNEAIRAYIAHAEHLSDDAVTELYRSHPPEP